MRFFPLELNSDVEKRIAALGWKKIEAVHDEFAVEQSPLPPGAGLTRFIIKQMESEKQSLVVVSWFTCDGGA